ncbi:hypothetical protein ACFXTH_031687 [Malus domestica]
MSYKEFDLYLDLQDDSTPGSKADQKAIYINLDRDRPQWKAKISLKLTNREKELFTNFIRANKDTFVWSVEDEPGIDPFVICHRLHLDPTVRPVI